MRYAIWAAVPGWYVHVPNLPPLKDRRHRGYVAAVNVDCLEVRQMGITWTVQMLRDMCESDDPAFWDSQYPFERCCKLEGGEPGNVSNFASWTTRLRLRDIPAVRFVTYGSGHFAGRARVLAQEAMRTGWFKSARGLGPDDLRPDFRARHADFLVKNPRLGGYGIWKPQIIIQELVYMNPGEVSHLEDQHKHSADCFLWPVFDTVHST